ncbi:hypothetical protein [Methylobacterium iners]|uniref:hypothetical protein n=1 Tax=Methylobacterium iners TaxID=418707 RepID=UPI001EE36375|nr:hypothetical protein [Methylobacterium iners]
MPRSPSLRLKAATGPTGPGGEKRPTDVIGNISKVTRMLTEEELEDQGAAPAEDEAATAMGREGAAARAAKMAPERWATAGPRAERPALQTQTLPFHPDD